MFKNKYNKYQNLIYEIFEQFQISDQSICLITKNNQESIYIYNGLKYFFDEDSLKLFPETEVLPYDHFSSPERVIQNRFKIINIKSRITREENNLVSRANIKVSTNE